MSPVCCIFFCLQSATCRLIFRQHSIIYKNNTILRFYVVGQICNIGSSACQDFHNLSYSNLKTVSNTMLVIINFTPNGIKNTLSFYVLMRIKQYDASIRYGVISEKSVHGSFLWRNVRVFATVASMLT